MVGPYQFIVKMLDLQKNDIEISKENYNVVAIFWFAISQISLPKDFYCCFFLNDKHFFCWLFASGCL